MKILKVLGVLVLTVVALFALLVVVSNFSAVESRFECSGEMQHSPSSTSSPVKVYFRLQEYRWSVGFWSDSDGSLWLEVPKRGPMYFEHVYDSGEQLMISTSDKAYGGTFSG
jgi:hypothetical protein